MPFWSSSKTSESSATNDHDLDRRASQNDPAASASQSAGTEWLQGHLHHLTEEQEGKLVEFKKLCEEKGYYTPASGAEGAEDEKKASHGDETMLYVLLSVVVLDKWECGREKWANSI